MWWAAALIQALITHRLRAQIQWKPQCKCGLRFHICKSGLMRYGGSTVLCTSHMSVSPSPGQRNCSAGKQVCLIGMKNCRGEKIKINIWAESFKQVVLLDTPQVVMSQQVFDDWQHGKHLLWTHWLHLLVAQWASTGTPGLSQYRVHQLWACLSGVQTGFTLSHLH